MSGNYYNSKIDGPGVYGTITVNTSAVEAKVGASVLEGRKVLTIISLDRDIYWGYDSSVTTATGTPLLKKQPMSLEFTDSVAIYLISTGSTDVRINEVG